MHHRIIRSALGAIALCLSLTAAAGERATPREARALFDQAVKYLEANGSEKAWSAFNDRKGPFVKKDLYVYVIDREDHLVGIVSLRSLVFADPNALVSEFMIRRIYSVSPLDKQEEVAHMISKYDLLALPVVDSDERLIGIVTADDALDKIIPTAWKKRLPRFFR